MRILLTTDFSTQAGKARDLVAGLALPAGATVRVVHAFEPITTVTAFAPMPIVDFTAEAEREIRAELEKFVAPLRARGAEVELALPFGRAADMIIAQAEQFRPDLIVIGNRGRGGIASMLLGSVSAEVIDRAPCPVLVARGTILSRVVLAEDGSQHAATGAQYLDLPIFRGLPVHVISVVDVPFPYPMPEDMFGAALAVEAHYDLLPRLRTTHERLARESAEILRQAGRVATWEMREGDAAAQIIDGAEKSKADCIVIGSRGQTGLTRLVLGSVARAVLFHAPCSVLIVHPLKRPQRRRGRARRSP